MATIFTAGNKPGELNWLHVLSPEHLQAMIEGRDLNLPYTETQETIGYDKGWRYYESRYHPAHPEYGRWALWMDKDGVVADPDLKIWNRLYRKHMKKSSQ